MSLRNRVVLVFVLLVLVVPATGWSASAQLNPDGQQLSSFGNDALGSVTPSVSPQPADTHLAAVEASPGAATAASLFDRFLVWLMAVAQPL